MEKSILITGATGGIGRAVAYLLASKGYSLYLHYNQNEQAMKTLLKELEPFGKDYLPIRCDLGKKGDYKNIINSIFSIDGIVHTSGISHYGLFTDIQDEMVESLWDIHVSSIMYISRDLLPKMLSKQEGNIIVISSIWGQIGASMEVAYSTVKGAQIAFVKALSKELAFNGIRVNGIAPGAVDTNMMASFTQEEKTSIQGEIPMGRMARPEEIAESVLFLLSEKSSYMTGQILSLNGGWSV
ncbi:elongation factor P 5-aminopentanone reductase [Niallia nealsonii]|uniref:3-oxoacyl-ACP reductase n=1 Tax=Niallia nealsonii TaxID=115979 RepID=A0A2N0Z0V9_9BACI|nr:3-oxoacyl-ACP reductase [Niallia nealsonii]